MKQGFFDLGTGETPRAIRSRTVKKKMGCAACGLFKDCTNPKIPHAGQGQLKILFIGESPTRTDDRRGKHFCGESGSLLFDLLEDIGINPMNDAWFTYAVRCKTPGGRNPTPIELNECRASLFRTIEELQPHVIVPMGIYAIKGLLGERFSGRISNTKEEKYFGEQIPDQDIKKWICPTYSPGHILKNDKDVVLKKQWEDHLRRAIVIARKQKKLPTPPDNTEITKEPAKAIEWIKAARKSGLPVAYDYETTGIKPHKSGHEIFCASIAFDVKGYAFPFFEDEPEFEKEWKLFLTGRAQKIAHKLDFENVWSYNRGGGVWPENYIWDTCIGAHCIDNTKPTNLKFHVYTKLGVLGFDESVDKYITKRRAGENKKSKNAINNISKCPLTDLLKYNAYDSLYTLALYEIQKDLLPRQYYDGFLFFLQGIQALSHTNQTGMRIDHEMMEIQYKRLSKKIQRTETQLEQFDEFQKWEKREPLNVMSDQQLKILLYEILKYRKPEKGGLVDEAALTKIGTPFIGKLLQLKKMKKLRDTYLAQLQREAVGDLVHPFFNLHLVTTFRSSSDSPNFQNIPKRDKSAKAIIRSCIRPRPGNRLVEWDYKGVEVSVGCAYHKDQNMIKYVTDPKNDMHRDTVMDMLMMTKEQITPSIRHIGKNGFVFPAFYGSSAQEIAPNVWGMLEPPEKEWLNKKGIMDLDDFTAHIEDVEKIFWGERFPQYSAWKRKTYNQYKKTGYVDLYTGFRCYGPMKYTEATNYPIQGSAFHCLLYTLINTQKKIAEISGRSCIIGQIHDAIVADIHPEDEETASAIIEEWGTRRIREEWDWINVPLVIEKEVSPVDGCWADMEDG